MATVNDIDTKAVVNRFLQRQVVTPVNDDEADREEEITAVLESVALSFQLRPQIALSMLLLAKNSLRQVVQADIDLVDFLLTALEDIDNPVRSVSDLSDLLEAQTALVELDRLQRVAPGLQAFRRYDAAVQRFLGEQLAPSLKRRARKKFERNGLEARTDIFNILPQFDPTHRVMADRLAKLAGGVSDFRSVALDRIVSTRTLARVRASLKHIKTRFEEDAISQTTAAVELLGGSAALQAVSTTDDILQATIRTGSLPSNRVITLRSEEAVSASALSSEGPWTLGATPWDFQMTLNAFSGIPTVINEELPAVGHEGKVYVTSEEVASYDIPASGTLYVQALGAATEEQEVALTTTGPAIPLATIISELNAGLTDVTAAQWGNTNRIALYGDVGVVTQIVVRGGASGASGTLNPDPSIHKELGFEINQTSLELGEFTAASLLDALEHRISGATFAVEGAALRITSNLDTPLTSSVRFDGGIEADFGFNGISEALPGYLVLVEDGQDLDPAVEGVYIGSLITATEGILAGSARRSINNEPVSDIDGVKLYFAISELPRSSGMSVTAEAPIVQAIEELQRNLAPLVGSFDNDFADLRQKMSPIISNPTRAQISDARRLMQNIRSRLIDVRDILDAVVVRDDRTQFKADADRILTALEGRGLDRAKDLLAAGEFSTFFSLSKANASRANRFMTSMSDVVNTDMPISIIEADIEDDVRVLGSNPDDNILPEADPPNVDEGLVPEL